MIRPIMQDGGIEVCAARPDHSMHFGIYGDLSEDSRITQRTVDFTFQHDFQIHRAGEPDIELQFQRIVPNDLDGCDAVERVIHSLGY